MAWDGAASIMPKDIQPAISLYSRFNHALYITHRGYISMNEGCLVALLPYSFDGSLTILVVYVSNDNLGSFLGKETSASLAYTGGSTSNNGYLSW